jgi:hypothetical protein
MRYSWKVLNRGFSLQEAPMYDVLATPGAAPEPIPETRKIEISLGEYMYMRHVEPSRYEQSLT